MTLHLLASGVPAKDRAAYLKKFADLVAAAEKATAGAKTDREKADHLLRFLHKGVMAKGYAEDQTTLHGVFDTGKFNCVSSSAVYFLVGTRLGLKLQPVLIPGEPYRVGHAAIDLIDGKAPRPDRADQPRRVRLAGEGEEARCGRDRPPTGPQEGLRRGRVRAGGGGGEQPRARRRERRTRRGRRRRSGGRRSHWPWTRPTRARPTTWPPRCRTGGWTAKEAKKYEDAVALYAFGRAALGDKGKLEHNYRVVWEHYLDEVFGAGKFEDGLKLVPRAAAAFPKEKKFADAAEWVGRAAHRKADKDGWEAGLAFADDGAEAPHGERREGRARPGSPSARRRWSQELLDKGDVDGSLKVLADGLKDVPGDKELLAGLKYHTQRGPRGPRSKKGGPAAAIAHFKELVREVPEGQGRPRGGVPPRGPGGGRPGATPRSSPRR